MSSLTGISSPSIGAAVCGAGVVRLATSVLLALGGDDFGEAVWLECATGNGAESSDVFAVEGDAPVFGDAAGPVDFGAAIEIAVEAVSLSRISICGCLNNARSFSVSFTTGWPR